MTSSSGAIFVYPPINPDLGKIVILSIESIPLLTAETIALPTSLYARIFLILLLTTFEDLNPSVIFSKAFSIFSLLIFSEKFHRFFDLNKQVLSLRNHIL